MKWPVTNEGSFCKLQLIQIRRITVPNSSVCVWCCDGMNVRKACPVNYDATNYNLILYCTAAGALSKAGGACERARHTCFVSKSNTILQLPAFSFTAIYQDKTTYMISSKELGF